MVRRGSNRVRVRQRASKKSLQIGVFVAFRQGASGPLLLVRARPGRTPPAGGPSRGRAAPAPSGSPAPSASGTPPRARLRASPPAACPGELLSSGAGATVSAAIERRGRARRRAQATRASPNTVTPPGAVAAGALSRLVAARVVATRATPGPGAGPRARPHTAPRRRAASLSIRTSWRPSDAHRCTRGGGAAVGRSCTCRHPGCG